MPIVLHVDATAGASIASRRGLGRVKHISTCFLWVQEVIAKKRITIKKIPGEDNPADLMTKAVDQKTLTRHMTAMGYAFTHGVDAKALRA